MSGINRYAAQNFVELLDCPRSLTANDILQVNSLGSAITQNSVSSIVNVAVGSGIAGDLAMFSPSGPPILNDSGLNASVAFGNIILQPSNPSNGMSLNSQQGVNLNTQQSVNVNAVNNVDLQAQGIQLISYDTISLNANNNVVIQCGPNQINITPSSVQINCGSGVGMSISNNNHLDVWNFSGIATGGSYTMPLTPAVGVCHLSNDGAGNLSWSVGA